MRDMTERALEGGDTILELSTGDEIALWDVSGLTDINELVT